MSRKSVAPISPTESRVPMESPDALFSPDSAIQTPVPAPLMLFQCIRFPLRGHYETDANGLLVHREDRFQKNEIAFPSGDRFSAIVSASDQYGLPTAFDVDHFLGMLRIADEKGYDPDGLLPGITFGQIINARDPYAEENGIRTNAVKRMLQRFANTTVTASFQQLLGPTGDYVEEEKVKWVIDYDRSTAMIAGDPAEIIRALRINPFWLREETGRLTAWIDVDIHNRQSQSTAKMAYLRLAIAAAQSQIDRYRRLDLAQWEEVVNASAKGTKPVDRANALLTALESLASDGVLERVERVREGRGRATRYTYYIEPGPVLNGLRHMGRVGRLDPPRTRALLYHLEHLGLVEGEARKILAQYGMRVQEVLQRIHYERTERGGVDARGKPVIHWRLWALKALQEGWAFEEPEYRAWLERQRARLFRPSAAEARPALAPQVNAQERSTEPAEVQLPNNLWGEAVEIARNEGQVSPVAVRLLADCWLVEVGESMVRIGSQTHAAVVERLYARALESVLSRILKRPVQLEIEESSKGPLPSP